MVNIGIDTSDLTHPRFAIPQLSNSPEFDGSTGVKIDLEPGRYNVVQIAGAFADFTFDVLADGTVDHDPAHDTFLGGRGSSTLVVRGFPVTVDTTALSHALITDIFAPRELPPGRHELVLVPAQRYRYLAGSGTNVDFSFDVRVDGTVRVDPTYHGFAVATGSTVTISGFAVRLDTRQHPLPLTPLIAGFVLGAQLLPGVHRFTTVPAPLMFGDGIGTTLLRVDRTGGMELLNGPPGLEVATDGGFCGFRENPTDLQIQIFSTPRGRWEHGRLKVSIDASAVGGMSPAAADAEIRRAFTDWAEVTDFFTFSFDVAPAEADIVVTFFGFDFDGSVFGDRLAVALSPPKGDIRFDPGQTWELPPAPGGPVAPAPLLLHYVALHEIGHSLGLSHSRAPASLMFGRRNDMDAIDDDSRRVLRAMYGARPQRPLPDRGTADRPALAAATRVTLGGGTTELRMVWRGADADERIYQSRLRDTGWSPQEHVPGRESAQGPSIASLALHDGTPSQGLIMAWRGGGTSQGIFTAVDPGSGWGPQQNVPGAGSSHAPAVADFGGPVLVWKGIGGDQGLWSSRFHNGAWTSQVNLAGAGTSAAPALAVLGNRLHLFWKGVEDDRTIHHTFLSEPQAQWTNPHVRVQVPTRLPDGQIADRAIGSTHGPVAAARRDAVRGDHLVLAWKGSDDRGVWYAEFDGEKFSGQVRMRESGTSTGPAIVAAGDVVHLAWRGVDSDSVIWFTAL